MKVKEVRVGAMTQMKRMISMMMITMKVHIKVEQEAASHLLLESISLIYGIG